MKLSKQNILWVISAIVSYALYVVVGLRLDGRMSYYLLGIIALLAIYSVFAQFKKAKDHRELKKVRDEILEQRWREEMESRNN
jgi:nicotinamide riboside transporter PnuC